VRGQLAAKRALEIAAAGGHNLLFVGPPGCGKTMLARRLPSILPPMTLREALDVTKIYSVAGLLANHAGVVSARPFRFPHHTISQTALVGGGVSIATRFRTLPNRVGFFHSSQTRTTGTREVAVCTLASSCSQGGRFGQYVALSW
jgi:predicted ATPase with chaperone activity